MTEEQEKQELECKTEKDAFIMFSDNPPNEDNLFNRVGRFSISDALIREAPEIIMQLFSKMLIIRAEYMFYNKTIEYVAFSYYFDVAPEGEEPPYYIFDARKDKEDNIEFCARRY